MNQNQVYFDYLQQRSFLGKIYRNFWLYPILNRFLKGRALDVGCGIGDMLLFRPNTIGVDVNQHNVSFCLSRGGDAKFMDHNVLPFDDASFDSVLLDNVLEHIQDPAPMLLEIKRVLRTNGVLLIGVPGSLGMLVTLIIKSFMTKVDSFHWLKVVDSSLIK